MIKVVVAFGAFIALGSGVAQAADWYTGAAPGRGPDDWIVATDSSVNVATNGSRVASIVGTAALTDTLSQSGPRLRVEALAGEHTSTVPAGTTSGRQFSIGVLGGYEWVMPGASIAVFAGVQARRDDWAVDLPGLPKAGGGIGFTTAFSLFARPTETTMVHAFASYASIRNAYFARARFGWAIGGFYAGPEVGLLGDDTFRQIRIGAHVSGLRVGPVQLGIAGGYQQDARAQAGAYASIDMRAGF